MYLRNCLLTIVGLICVSSVSFAEDFVLDHLGSAPGFSSASYPTSGRLVSSLPGEVFGASNEEMMASVRSLEAEEQAVQRANSLVLVGLFGTLLAAISATGLFFAWRKQKAKSATAGIQLVGI